MAFVHGRNTDALIGSVDLSAVMKNTDLTIEVDMADTTAYGKSAMTYIPGLQNGSISLEGMFDTGLSGGDANLSALIPQVFAVTVGPNGLAIGERAFVAEVLNTSYAVSDPVGDVVAVTFEGQTTDTAGWGVSLEPLISQSVTANAASVDNLVTSPGGLVAALHVSSVTAGNVVVRIQDSADNSSFTTIATFATAVNATNQVLRIGGTVRRYLRASWTIVTGPATFAVSARRLP